MIDTPDDAPSYELEPIPERPRPAWPTRVEPPRPVVPPRPRFQVRWRYVLGGAYLLALASVLYAYETSDDARARRLSRHHHEQARACHQAAVAARRLGRIDEAAVLDDRARNHAWFADRYQGVQSDRPRWHPRPASDPPDRP